MSDRLLSDYIGRLRADMDEQAHGSCRFPKADPFEHGVQVGKYQGMEGALKLLTSLIEEQDQQERSS